MALRHGTSLDVEVGPGACHAVGQGLLAGVKFEVHTYAVLVNLVS
jgi:hypothetical protein